MDQFRNTNRETEEKLTIPSDALDRDSDSDDSDTNLVCSMLF